MGFKIKYAAVAKSIANRTMRSLGYSGAGDARRSNTAEARKGFVDFAKKTTGLTLSGIVGDGSQKYYSLLHPSILMTPNCKSAQIFTKAANLKRPSLAPNRYKDGVHNIITLISLGYKTDKTHTSSMGFSEPARVHGVWRHNFVWYTPDERGGNEARHASKKKKIWSLPERDPYTRYKGRQSVYKFMRERTLEYLMDALHKEAVARNLQVTISAGGAIIEYFEKTHKSPIRQVSRVSLYKQS